ncbi:MAG: phage holin family protein [Planctomycetes bacterium]|nr:phage holin family protein [Planctomycetota bacterium]
MNFIIALLLNALALLLTSKVVSGITVKSYGAAIIAAIILAIANALVKPILVILTFPVTILTLGLFILVINALVFMVSLNVVNGIEVSGFWAGFWGCIVYSILSYIIHAMLFGSGPTSSAP